MRKKVLTALVLSALMAPIPSNFAWGGFGHIIRPGSQVIDVKRLADSIQETAQQALTYANMAQDRILFQQRRLSANFSEFTNKAISKMDQYLGSVTPLNPKVDPKTTEIGNAVEQNLSLPTYTYQNQLTSAMQTVNVEGLTQYQQTVLNTQNHMAYVTRILQKPTTGVEGETQKGLALEVVAASAKADAVKAAAARLIQQSANTNISIKEDTYNENVAKTRYDLMHMGDPYHPSEYREQVLEKAKNKSTGFTLPEF